MFYLLLVLRFYSNKNIKLINNWCGVINVGANTALQDRKL